MLITSDSNTSLLQYFKASSFRETYIQTPCTRVPLFTDSFLRSRVGAVYI